MKIEFEKSCEKSFPVIYHVLIDDEEIGEIVQRDIGDRVKWITTLDIKLYADDPIRGIGPTPRRSLAAAFVSVREALSDFTEKVKWFDETVGVAGESDNKSYELISEGLDFYKEKEDGLRIKIGSSDGERLLPEPFQILIDGVNAGEAKPSMHGGSIRWNCFFRTERNPRNSLLIIGVGPTPESSVVDGIKKTQMELVAMAEELARIKKAAVTACKKADNELNEMIARDSDGH